MTQKISRRDMLKLAGLGATTAVLTGCGPASKYVKREPYFSMPEYTYNGESTFYATTCRECAAGCGTVIRTMQGRALKVEGNKNHPLNLGKTCARGQAALEGLYNPDRVTGPLKQGRGNKLSGSAVTWDNAIGTVAEALKNHKPDEIAFLMGLAPDHLFDLASELTGQLGAPAPIRFGALGMFESRATLSRAAEELFGQAAMPFFDLANADVVFSFGANFLETWLSPVAYTRGYSRMRKGKNRRRGYLVQFEARMSQTAAVADEWIPIKPGSEGLVAAAIGKLAAEARGASAGAFKNVDAAAAAKAAGVSLEKLEYLAGLLASAFNPLALAGGAALAQSNGLQTAKSVLALDALLGNIGQPGGVFLSPLAPGQEAYHRPASAQEMGEFVQKINSGAVKVLFIHGVNPAFELPKSFGFIEALKKVETVISFATFPDETALMADYIFPDHHGLESFGYQRVFTGAAESALSGAQPTVTPFHDTRATADVLLAAAAQAGQALPYADEYEFVKSKLRQFVPLSGGFFAAPEINTFMAYFQQYGGWWQTGNALVAPAAANAKLNLAEAEFEEGEFFLVPFVSPTLGEAGANKPWLQEAPDPTTTVMWNTWVEINPETAHELHLENDDIVRIVSAAGEVEAPVYLYPAIRPDTIAIPFGQGHTAYGRYAAGRGVNPADLFGPRVNEAGDLAFAGTKVRVEKAGKYRVLSRLESKIGVYGEGMGEGH
ncbi:MAG: Nitrate reductase [Anaerolineales bacterium]|nr:Nitrate reductase [Anaerolineales bacterium]